MSRFIGNFDGTWASYEPRTSSLEAEFQRNEPSVKEKVAVDEDGVWALDEQAGRVVPFDLWLLPNEMLIDLAKRPETSPRVLDMLADEKDNGIVRYYVAYRENVWPETLTKIARSETSMKNVFLNVLNNKNVPAEALRVLFDRIPSMDDGFYIFRRKLSLAKNSATDLDILQVLAKDSNNEVAKNASKNLRNRRKKGA